MPITTLYVLPAAMLACCFVIIIIAIHHRTWETSPAFLAMIIMLAIRCAVYLCGMWRMSTFLSSAAPLFFILAAEESVRNCGVREQNDRLYVWRYRFCVGFGIFIGCLSIISGNAEAKLRAASQTCAAGMMIASLLKTWRFGSFSCFALNARQAALTMYLVGAIASSRLSAEEIAISWWSQTLATESTQIVMLLCFMFMLKI